MIECLIALCARQRIFTVIGVLVAVGFGIAALFRTSLDAVPDLSDTQVIIFTEWMGRSPNLVEDQITYPIVTTFLAAPKVKVVRGFTMFGMSFVYIIFEDGTDLYWARTRVLEYLSSIKGKLPPSVTPALGPDATGLGWVFQYALVDDSGKSSLSDLRTFQDWTLRYRLQSVPGVAEVASFGGYVQQYQVTVDPNRLKAFGLGITDVAQAVRQSNGEVGGRLLEISGREYMVRGRGYVGSTKDLEAVVLKTDERGTPVLVRDVGHVALGPEIRRGVSDLLTGLDLGPVIARRASTCRACSSWARVRMPLRLPARPDRRRRLRASGAGDYLRLGRPDGRRLLLPGAQAEPGADRAGLRLGQSRIQISHLEDRSLESGRLRRGVEQCGPGSSSSP